MDIQLNLKRLTECREKAGLSKRETAKRINVSQPAYVRYENGTRIPSIQVVTAIANALNTSVAYLTDQTDLDTPDFILIDKDTSPMLFSLVEACKDYDEDKLKQLKQYIDTL